MRKIIESTLGFKAGRIFEDLKRQPEDIVILFGRSRT
jgi:hypothetical protein